MTATIHRAAAESDAENAEAIRFTSRLQRIGWVLTAGLVLVFLAAAVSKNFLGLELNAMGDALAGFFSGLAFLWLVLTMQLQIKELELQRKELRLARIANEEQTTQLAGTKEATQSELEVLRVNQAMLLEERVKRLEDDATRAVLSQVVYDLVPTLMRSTTFARAVSAIPEWPATFAESKTLLTANRFAEGLSTLANLLDSLEIKVDKEAVLPEISGISGMREKLELLSTLLTVFSLNHHSAKQHRRIQYYFGVQRLESSLKWVLAATRDLPSATDVYRNQLATLREGLEESERLAAEMRQSAEKDAAPDGNPRDVAK